MYFYAAAERIEPEFKTRGLALTRGGFVVMMADSDLSSIMDWINGAIRMTADRSRILQKSEMYQ